MTSQYKPRVTTKLEYDRIRPPSPYKARPATAPTSPSLPTFKPKAKVNSTATPLTRKQTLAASPSPRPQTYVGPPTVGGAPRAPSPFKPPGQNGGSPMQVKARLTAVARPASARAPSPVSEARARALTATASTSGSRPPVRARHGSISSHVTHASRVPSPAASAATTPNHSPTSSRVGFPSADDGGSAVGASRVVRVKSKISKLDEIRGSPSAPSFPSVLSASPPPSPRARRIPSISLSPPLRPAAVNGSPQAKENGAPRFATTREKSPPRAHVFQPFPSNDDLAVKYNSVPAKVDPSSVPLPPQSPPTSTLSFSSRSSASRSSASYDAQTSDTSRNAQSQPHLTVRVDSLGLRTEPPVVSSSQAAQATFLAAAASSPTDTSFGEDAHDRDPDTSDERDPDRKIKAAAKSIRKIADLEITNRSLMAINATLEATKHRQAKEIRDLKRRLRESILILPPPAFRAAKSSLGPSASDASLLDEADDEADDEDNDEDDAALLEGRDDEPYRRVKLMLDGLLESCTRALQTAPEDFEDAARGGTKVLSAEEVRSWRGERDPERDESETRSLVETERDDAESARLLSPARGTEELGSESEVEASLMVDSRSPSPLPPITVTLSQ